MTTFVLECSTLWSDSTESKRIGLAQELLWVFHLLLSVAKWAPVAMKLCHKKRSEWLSSEPSLSFGSQAQKRASERVSKRASERASERASKKHTSFLSQLVSSLSGLFTTITKICSTTCNCLNVARWQRTREVNGKNQKCFNERLELCLSSNNALGSLLGTLWEPF